MPRAHGILRRQRLTSTPSFPFAEIQYKCKRIFQIDQQGQNKRKNDNKFGGGKDIDENDLTVPTSRRARLLTHVLQNITTYFCIFRTIAVTASISERALLFFVFLQEYVCVVAYRPVFLDSVRHAPDHRHRQRVQRFRLVEGHPRDTPRHPHSLQGHFLRVCRGRPKREKNKLRTRKKAPERMGNHRTGN